MSGGFRVGSAYTVRSNGNVETVGVITATKFSGDGANITGISTLNITGYQGGGGGTGVGGTCI